MKTINRFFKNNQLIIGRKKLTKFIKKNVTYGGTSGLKGWGGKGWKSTQSRVYVISFSCAGAVLGARRGVRLKGGARVVNRYYVTDIFRGYTEVV